MSAVPLDLIKELRVTTGVSMMACKSALEETKGDMQKAIDFLRKKGMTKAAERAGRETKNGVIGSYVHSTGRIGVLVEVVCETDFVAKNPDFVSLAHDLAMQVAASDPLVVSPSDVPAAEVEKESTVWQEQLKTEGKPEKIWPNILKGKEQKFREEKALLSQPFVKNPDTTIEKLLADAVLKLGENIQVRRFTRFSV